MENGLLYRGLGEKGEIFTRETLFIGDSGKYVKEDSGNRHLSP
jgi:hypothetical protein